MSTTDAAIAIQQAVWPRDLAAARALLLAYQHHLLNNPTSAAHICIEGYDRELAELPEQWGGDRATLLLAWQDGLPAGCVGVRLLPDREYASEMKRMWVPPESRGKGLGRRLVTAAIDWSRDKGARELLLDTAPEAMPEAQHLYRSMGFVPCDRYNRNPVPGIVFFRLAFE